MDKLKICSYFLLALPAILAYYFQSAENKGK